MDYEMQYRSHPHTGGLRTEGGCPALARWRRDQQFGNVWQDQRSWGQQSLFPPASSDAFLHPHPHPHPSFLHWPPSSTASHGPPSLSRPPDSNFEASFDHQIPEFALPPINHPPYSPLTFVPPLFRPQRNNQAPQGPGDFQHILHSQPSQSSTADMEGHRQASPDRLSSTNPQPTFSVPPTASTSPSESPGSISSHVNEQSPPSLGLNHNPSNVSIGRVGGDEHSPPPGRQSVPNLQPYARLPPPASGSRGHSSDAASERAARALQEQYGSSAVSFGPPSRGYFTASTPAFAALRSRARAGSNGGNSEAAGSPYSSLDDDSDLEEGSPRLQQTGFRSVRQAQILRGQMSSKRVASQRAILTLQPVEVDSLPDSERSMDSRYPNLAGLNGRANPCEKYVSSATTNSVSPARKASVRPLCGCPIANMSSGITAF